MAVGDTFLPRRLGRSLPGGWAKGRPLSDAAAEETKLDLDTGGDCTFEASTSCGWVSCSGEMMMHAESERVNEVSEETVRVRGLKGGGREPVGLAGR